MSVRVVARAAFLGVAALVVGAWSSRPAAAQGFYLGAASSHAAIDETVIEDTQNSYKLFLGYEFPRSLGIEVAWVDFGDFDGVITAEGGSTAVGYDAKTATAAFTYRIPVGELVTLYGKAGYMYWSTDVTLTGTVLDPEYEAGTDNGTDFFYGGGLRLTLGKISVLGEWERYKLDTVDINAVSAGVRLSF